MRIRPFERIVRLLTPSTGEKLIRVFCDRLTDLSPEKRSAEFDNVGQALFFSLNSCDKYILLKKLKILEAETPYLKELTLELQERFSQALESGITTLLLETDTTLTQDFLQNCLFELLIKGNASTAPEGFEKYSFVDQLQIVYYLYRIIYHSELTDKSDLYIHQLLAKLPEAVGSDIASKAKDTTTKELCLALIEHYIQPGEAPQTIRQTCLKLFFCPPPCIEAIAPSKKEQPIGTRQSPAQKGIMSGTSDPQSVKEAFFKLYADVESAAALKNFARLSREEQRPIHAIIEGMAMIDEKTLAAYQLAAFERLTRDEQSAIINRLTNEDLMEEYVDVAHPTIRERVGLLWERSSEPTFGSIVKTALQVLPTI